ncbi:MAG TPA: cation:proton antiporter [Thermomicrobiales bacterium]|nr:cation:proton antiporter [Thermomicrobiales bacterium]
MEDIRIILDLVMALGVATIAGVAADRVGIPVLLGYVAAGMAIGPHTPGLFANEDRVMQLANLGVAFLMFTIGAELSLRDLLAVRRVALIAATIQMPLAFAFGLLTGRLIGWDAPASVLLGAIFTISSSIVLIKVVLNRGEATSRQARYGIGLMVVQDLSLVPILALLPVLEGETGNIVFEIGRSLALASVALAIVLVLGTRLVPALLYRVARTSSHELFLLTIVTIALGTALASHYAGLSLALGAFLAGLVVSESEFDAQVMVEIAPLRDLFATLFFVSLGMLVQPAVIADQPLVLLLMAVTLIGGKLLAGTMGFLASRINPFVAVSAGFLSAQIGEFSFVLAGSGLESGIITSEQYGLVIALALISILIAPGLPSLAVPVASVINRFSFARDVELETLETENQSVELRRHVVICGYGRVAAELGAALERRGAAYVVIDINAATVRELRRRGIPAIYGDAGRRSVLEHAGVAEARTVAVTVPDLLAASAAIRFARELNPTVDIIARAGVRGEVFTLRADGASEVVQPEFEAGLEFTRYVLRRLGVSARELELVSARRRSRYYQQAEDEPVFIDELG